MSLDSVLRSRLVASGENIAADVERGLRDVHGAVVRRRRRVTVGAAAIVALMLVATETGTPELRRPGPPPAREVDERLGPPDVRRRDGGAPVQPVPSIRTGAPARRGVSGAAGEAARPAGVAAYDGSGSGERIPRAKVADAVPPPEVRSFVERYEKTKVGVIATGENGGLACSDGEGSLGGDDCFMFEVLGHETRLEIRLLDDGGVPVPAHVYQYPPGSPDAQDLGNLCGGTVSPLVVTPGSTIAVYIASTEDCPGPTTTGTMRVRLWEA